MAVKDAAPEDVAALPQDFAVPTYNANNQPLYDNQLFPAVKSVEDLVARGYATPDGQVTESGQMALSLRKVGALNDDYTLNDTGRAVLSKREDLLEPENLNLYGKAEELNLDDDGRGMGERFSAGVKELWKSTQDLGAALYEEAEPAMGAIQAIGGLAKGPAGVVDVVSGIQQQLATDYTPEQRAATRIRTEKAIKNFSDQGAYTLLGAGELMMRGAMSTPVGITGGSEVDLISQAQKDSNILATRQARERIINDAQNVEVSEAVDKLTNFTKFVESYKQAAELLGPERTKEVEAQGAAVGLAASIINPATPEAAAFGAAFKVARGVTAPISGAFLRSEQKAQRVLAKTQDLTALQKQAAEYQLTVKAIEQQAARAEDTAAKLSQRGFVDRANSTTTAANALRRKAQEASVRFGGLQDEITRVSDDLATLTKDATVADKFNQMMQKAKEVPYMPITVVGQGLEYVGRGMIGIDKGLSKLASKIGVDKAYNAMNKISSLSGLGTVGAAAGLGPAAFIPAAIKATWSTAPFIQGAGRFINLVGKEAMKSRADIDFWKRIYAMPNQGPVNRAIAGFMDTATLGGRVTDFGVRTTKGVLASVPADLAFQYVAEGGKMDAGSIGEALSEAVFFGGAGGGLGAITMGSKQKIRSLQNGNALNFYRTLEDPQQRVMFNGMPEDYRRAIGTFSATNPGARVMFTTIGGGGIDPNTNTIYINPNSSNPIKPLVTHEFMHHMMNNGIGEGIVAQLVGDGYQTGGILRTADGKYEPQYEAFKEEYVDRLRQQHAQMIKMREAIGDKIPANEREFQAPSEKYLAEEYFIESNVEDMLGLVESGKFGKMAGRMIINDKVRALGDSILNKSSILRDLHFKLGGVMDKNGKMVSGNGFLGGQMYQSPEIRRMFKKMVSDSVGRKGGFDQARVKAKEGVKLKINSKSDPILKSMVSLWEGDADGVPFLDKDGDLVPLKKETEEMRSTAGLLLIEDQNRRQANGETIAEGQLAYNPDTQTWSGKYLTEDQIKILRLSGRFNNPQIRQLEMLNEAAKATLDPNAAPETRGNRFSIIYQAALKRNKKGKWRYDQIEPSLRDVVPYGVEITKKGNILIRIMSTNQMHANISKKAASKKGIQLYDGNIEAILRDVNRVIELHGEADGKPTDAHFKEKYGAAWESHKAFINSVFGNVGAGHKDINPLVASDKVDAVVKTYRLDRINKATQMVGSTNLPYQNNLVKINYLPEGEPILDENGEPKDLRYTPSYEDSQVRMPEAQRAMPEGVSPEDLNPVANKQEAQGRWADGKQMFAINEMDEQLIPITSKAMLESYPADAIGWMEPEPQKSVALRTNQAQERPVNERQPTTIQTQPSGASVSGSEATGEGLRQQGGLSRGTEQLQPQGRPGDQGIPLAGLPATVTVPGIGKYTFGPNEIARSIAADYARSAGIDYNPPRTYAKVDTERAKRIADEYEKMAHNPNDPKVKESYDAMIKETLDQWEAIKKTGLKVEPIPAGSPDPYAASPRLALIDVKDNNHLWFFPTASGFGGTESAGIDISGNPLMQPTGEIINGHPMLANDVFRIVHDYFGHIKEGVGFRADGEENAWRSHSAMYSDKARPAMTAETRGQNSWVNFGPFAEFNKTATGADTQYAPQKTGLLPDWVMTEGSSDARFMPEGDGSINLMKQTNLGGDASMIMSAKWGTPKQTSQSVALSDKPENHIVGLSRIKGLLKAKDLSDKQKSSLDDFLVKTASFATDSPGFRDLGTPTNKEEALTIISKVTDRMARNLLAIYDAVPPPIRSYWQRWYPLAYDWNQAQSAKHKITRQVVAGINARLSPGKDWIHNVNMTERILSSFAGDVSMTQEIADGAMPIIDNALETKLNSKENKNKEKAWIDEQKAKVNAAKKEVQNLVGMKVSEMTDAQAAQLIRYYTQVVGDNRVLNYFEQGNPVYADAISWQSFSNLEKAINMYRDPSMENISNNMGSDHKIRSFFNNQESPNDNVLRDVTSDTHAVAAAYLLPLSQSSQQVARNFGGSSNAVSGLNGMYYIVADAYRKAADARNVEPRAMQSITWEGARSMFPRGFKKAENVKKVEAIWNRFEKRELTKQQALQEINKLLIDFFAKNPNSRPRFAVLPR
jgi:hypothetical protein